MLIPVSAGTDLEWDAEHNYIDTGKAGILRQRILQANKTLEALKLGVDAMFVEDRDTKLNNSLMWAENLNPPS